MLGFIAGLLAIAGGLLTLAAAFLPTSPLMPAKRKALALWLAAACLFGVAIIDLARGRLGWVFTMGLFAIVLLICSDKLARDARTVRK